MTTQKIITLVINQDDGVLALREIQEAAGPGTWRIVSLLDLHDTQGYRNWLPDRNRDHGRRVLVVLEQEQKVEKTSSKPFPEVALN